jgi:hypothetical protein
MWDKCEVPAFRPLGYGDVQVRATASTHDESGMIRSFDEKIRPNTERLLISKTLDRFPVSRKDLQEGAEDLVISYGYTSYAATEAVRSLRSSGRRVSHVVVRTLFPVLIEDFQSPRRQDDHRAPGVLRLRHLRDPGKFRSYAGPGSRDRERPPPVPGQGQALRPEILIVVGRGSYRQF